MEGYSLRVQSCAPNFVNSNSDETRVWDLVMLLASLQWRKDGQSDLLFRKYMAMIGLYRLNLLLYASLASFKETVRN